MFVVLIEDVCRVLFDNDEKRVHDGRWWERWAEGRISWLGFSPGRRGPAVCVYCSCLFMLAFESLGVRVCVHVYLAFDL